MSKSPSPSSSCKDGLAFSKNEMPSNGLLPPVILSKTGEAGLPVFLKYCTVPSFPPIHRSRSRSLSISPIAIFGHLPLCTSPFMGLAAPVLCVSTGAVAEPVFSQYSTLPAYLVKNISKSPSLSRSPNAELTSSKLPGIATKDSNGFDTPVIRSKSTDVAGMFTQYSKVPSCDVTTVYEK